MFVTSFANFAVDISFASLSRKRCCGKFRDLLQAFICRDWGMMQDHSTWLPTSVSMWSLLLLYVADTNCIGVYMVLGIKDALACQSNNICKRITFCASSPISTAHYFKCYTSPAIYKSMVHSSSASQEIPDCLWKPGNSLRFSQRPTTSPSSEPDECSLRPPIVFLCTQFQYYPSIYEYIYRIACLLKAFSSTHNAFNFFCMCAIYPSILGILDFITRIIRVFDENTSRICSLYSSLPYPVTALPHCHHDVDVFQKRSCHHTIANNCAVLPT